MRTQARRGLSLLRTQCPSSARCSAVRHYLSTARIDAQHAQRDVNNTRRPSAYGWQYHLDNTVQFILWASFGSAAIHLLNIKQKYSEKERKLSTKIALLKDVIRRIQDGEEVDVAKELKVGKTEDEREWEEVMNSFRENAGLLSEKPEDVQRSGAILVHETPSERIVADLKTVPRSEPSNNVQEFKVRDLTEPFLFLPFRLASASASISDFINQYFSDTTDEATHAREITLLSTLDLVSILRWTYSRLPGKLISHVEYEAFRKFEHQSEPGDNTYKVVLREVFACEQREMLFYGLMDFMLALAAQGHQNGHSIMQLGSLCAILVFPIGDRYDFKAVYNSWTTSVLATQHLFLGYLKALTSEQRAGISAVPRSLHGLVDVEAYPPRPPCSNILCKGLKLKIAGRIMSPSPLSLLSRALSHAHRIDSQTLDLLSTSAKDFGLDTECFRILKAIQAVSSKECERMPRDARDAEWLEFGNHGFQHKTTLDLGNDPDSKSLYKRLTPNWSEFMLAGFDNVRASCAPQFLPMHLHLPEACADPSTGKTPAPSDPGVLSEVNTMRIDKSLWSSWVLSLASEMSNDVKGIFGRVVIVQPAACKDFVIVEEVVLQTDKTTVPESKETKVTRPSIFRALTRRMRKHKPLTEVVLVAAATYEPQRNRIEERLCGVLRKTRLSDLKSKDCSEQKATNESRTNAASIASDRADLDRDDDVRAIIKWTKSYDESQDTETNCRASDTELLDHDLLHTRTATHSQTGSTASQQVDLCRFVNASDIPDQESLQHSIVKSTMSDKTVENDPGNLGQHAVQTKTPRAEKYVARPRMLKRLLSLRFKKDRPVVERKPSREKSQALKPSHERPNSGDNGSEASQGQTDSKYMYLNTKKSFVAVPMQRTTTVSSLASTNISTIFLPMHNGPPMPTGESSGGRSASRGEIVVRCDVEVVEEISRIEQKVLGMAK